MANVQQNYPGTSTAKQKQLQWLKGEQTQVTVPHKLATDAVPELRRPVLTTKVAEAQPTSQDVGAETPSKSNDHIAIPQLCSRSAQTNVVFRPTSAV